MFNTVDEVNTYLNENVANIVKLCFHGHWNCVKLVVNNRKIYVKSGLYEDTKNSFSIVDTIKELFPKMVNLYSFTYDDVRNMYYPSSNVYGKPMYIDVVAPSSLKEFNTNTLKCPPSFISQLTHLKVETLYCEAIGYIQNLKKLSFWVLHKGDSSIEQLIQSISTQGNIVDVSVHNKYTRDDVKNYLEGCCQLNYLITDDCQRRLKFTI
jgi:hypothetical protein